MKCLDIDCHDRGGVSDRELQMAASVQHPKRVALHTANLGTGQNPEFEVQFLLNVYRFCTIAKSKNHKSNHCKSGTTGIVRVYLHLNRHSHHSGIPFTKNSFYLLSVTIVSVLVAK